MRSAVIVVAAMSAACGRLDFDALDARDARSPDAAIDAAPCVPMDDNDDDRDGVADSCDTCPHVPGAQLDSDGDGVGDLCDPLATPTESFVKFETFRAMPAWPMSKNAPFMASDSALVGKALASYAWIGYPDDPTNTEVVMRGRVDAIGTGDYQLSMQFAHEEDIGSEYCEVYRTPTPSLKITRGIPPDTFENLADMPMAGFAPGPFTMRYGHTASGLRCELTIGGQTYVLTSPQSFAVPRDFIALQFIDVDVTVESFAQIDTTP